MHDSRFIDSSFLFFLFTIEYYIFFGNESVRRAVSVTGTFIWFNVTRT